MQNIVRVIIFGVFLIWNVACVPNRCLDKSLKRWLLNVDKVTIEFVFLKKSDSIEKSSYLVKKKYVKITDKDKINRVVKMFGKKTSGIPNQMSNGGIEYFQGQNVVCSARFYLPPRYNNMALRCDKKDYFYSMSKEGIDALSEYRTKLLVDNLYENFDTLFVK